MAAMRTSRQCQKTTHLFTSEKIYMGKLYCHVTKPKQGTVFAKEYTTELGVEAQCKTIRSK
jgi:hypothetical protein